MPVHDWCCAYRDCDFEVLDRYQARLEELEPPVCPKHMERMVKMWSTNRKNSFQAFSADIDGKVIQFDSLKAVRDYERESANRARNGEGQPVVFRAFSQDPSRQDVNTFSGDYRRPAIQRFNHRGVPLEVRRSMTDPRDTRVRR